MSKRKVKEILGKILGWGFGVLFGLMGIGGLSSGNIFPAIILFIIPPISNFIRQNLLSQKMKNLLIIALIIILFIAIGVSSSTTTRDNSTVTQDDKVETTPSSNKNYVPSGTTNKNQDVIPLEPNLNSEKLEKIDFSSEKVKLPNTPKYTNKECQRLCYATAEDSAKQGVYNKILISRCKEYCDQTESLGGSEKLKSAINDIYLSALIINAKKTDEIRYCTKYEFLQTECIINQIEFEENALVCNLLTYDEDKSNCVQKFLKTHEEYSDAKICDMLLKKNQCLLIVKTREAIKTKNPKICLTLSDKYYCYGFYFDEILKFEFDSLTHNRKQFILQNLEISESDFTEEFFNNLPHTLSYEIIMADWSLCNTICQRNPDHLNNRDMGTFSAQECDRTICLSNIVLYNTNKDYTDCTKYSTIGGGKSAFVDCLMAEAKRDNNLELCNEFSGEFESFISICKNNVNSWQK